MTRARFYYKQAEAPQPNKPTHLGVAAFVEQEGLVLLEKRVDSGCWALIGGGLKIDESLEECLGREIGEETGLTLLRYRLFGIFSDPSRIIAYPDGNVIRSVTVVYRVEVEPFAQLQVSDESLELRFCTREELQTFDIVETHRHIVDRYLENGGQLVVE